MKLRNRPSLLICVLILVLAPAVTQAQRRMNPNAQAQVYDPKTEVTVKGTVEEVQTETMPPSPRGRGPMAGMMGGTHLTLKTDKGNMDVRLGPSSYLAEKKFSIDKGDKLEITGSLVKVAGADALIAREVKKGKATLELRDKNGMPLWSGYPGVN